MKYVTGIAAILLAVASPQVLAAPASCERVKSDIEQRIIVDRNHTMAERAAPILAEGNVFMAVGALHLPGPEGVVELLRGKGFTVTAVK